MVRQSWRGGGAKSARAHGGKPRTRIIVAIAMAVAFISVIIGVQVASAGPTGGRFSPASLKASFAKGKDLASLPASGVGNLVPGSVHIARDAATGDSWAVASFEPSPSLDAAAKVSFQDGGGTGIFEQRPGHSWQFVQVGRAPLGCDTAIPLSVRKQWGMTAAGSCAGTTTIAAQSRLQAIAEGAKVGPIAKQITKLALSQLGVDDNPSTENFGFDCDPYTTLTGPAPAAADNRGCGFSRRFNVDDEGEEWCSDFTSWVWEHAGVTEDTVVLNSGANSFYDWGLSHHANSKINSTDFKVGDAVVFYEPGLKINANTYADHVGTIVKVNANRTIDMVNGDFNGPEDINVQENANIHLRAFANTVWTKGEQWVLVTPPETRQPAAPSHLSINAPHVAATGTAVNFRASAVVTGGHIKKYWWAFGGGEYIPGGFARGADAKHVFSDPGRVTVTLTAQATNGSIRVKTWNVDVVSAGTSTATAIANNAWWYLYLPVTQQVFVNDRSGGLSEQSTDGAGWLDESLPGNFVHGGHIAALAYKDPDDIQAPHIFGPASNGTVAETYEDGPSWKTLDIPGDPAATSPIGAAYTVPAGAAGNVAPHTVVFYFNARHQLTESSDAGGKWRAATVATAAAAARPNGKALAVGTITIAGTPRLAVYYTSAGGHVWLLLQTGKSWTSALVGAEPVSTNARSNGLTAVDSQGTGSPGLFYVSSSGQIVSGTPGPYITRPHGGGVKWTTRTIARVKVNASAGLEATDRVPSKGVATSEVIAVADGGSPVQFTRSGTRWTEHRLAGRATHLQGLAAYALSGAGQRLVYATHSGVAADTESSAGKWTHATLPATPATWLDHIVLYAADSANLTLARQAATEAGLPAGQVTGSFYKAWSDGIDPDYLVIAIGLPAVDALDFNKCNWANPTGLSGGATPFTEITDEPIDTLPGIGLFEPAAGTTPADTATLADGLAYYAVHGQLPSGTTTLPAQAPYEDTCAGSSNAG